MSEKHTPGPWHWNGQFNVTVGSGASWIARTIGLATGDGTDTEREPNEARANAALIASAPDLLAALAELSYWSDRINSLQHAGMNILASTWSELWDATNKARAALAKAEG
jgi:hypothetical protein